MRLRAFVFLGVLCLQCTNLADGLLWGFFGYGILTLAGTYISYHTYCHFNPCCNSNWIRTDTTALEKALQEKLYGQHLAQEAIVGPIGKHLKRAHIPGGKPLALSFIGPPGVGKTYISKIIAESMYKEGSYNHFVELLTATRDFPHLHKVGEYKARLKDLIFWKVMIKCKHFVFIIDEADKMPSDLLDFFYDYLLNKVEGVDTSKAIFFFLSNTGGTEISQRTFDHWQEGKKREDLTINVEHLQIRPDENDHRGLWNSRLVTSGLIETHIPFLPLERQHVKECIKDTLIDKGYCSRHRTRIPERLVDSVMQELSFTPEIEQLFSASGCKRVADKVAYVMLDDRC